MFEEPQEGCNPVTERFDGITTNAGYMYYKKDVGPPSEAGYVYLQYNSSYDACQSNDLEPLYQKYWYLGMCYYMYSASYYSTITQISYTESTFTVETTWYDESDVDCNKDDGTYAGNDVYYSLSCPLDYWVQLNNMKDQSFTVENPAVFWLSIGVTDCNGNTEAPEIFDINYVSNLYGQSITYDTCTSSPDGTGSLYISHSGNFRRGIMSIDLSIQDSFSCAGTVPIQGNYLEEGGCFAMSPSGSASVPKMNFSDDTVSYISYQYSDSFCEDYVDETLVIQDVSFQCGQQRFLVAYPNGLKIENGDNSDDSSIDWWLILVIVVCGVFVIAVPAFLYYWRKRKSKEGVLNKALLGDFNYS